MVQVTKVAAPPMDPESAAISDSQTEKSAPAFTVGGPVKEMIIWSERLVHAPGGLSVVKLRVTDPAVISLLLGV